MGHMSNLSIKLEQKRNWERGMGLGQDIYYLGLGGHEARTCSYGIVPKFIITWFLIDLVPTS